MWPKFEFTPKLGGQTEVFAYFLLSDFHSFCNLGPKVMVQSRMRPEKRHSMQVSNKNYTQQSSDVDSFGLVYAGIYCFAIPAGATRGRMVFDSDLTPRLLCPCIKNGMHMARFSEPMFTIEDVCEPYQAAEPMFTKEDFCEPYQAYTHTGVLAFPS